MEYENWAASSQQHTEFAGRRTALCFAGRHEHRKKYNELDSLLAGTLDSSWKSPSKGPRARFPP